MVKNLDKEKKRNDDFFMLNQLQFAKQKKNTEEKNAEYEAKINQL